MSTGYNWAALGIALLFPEELRPEDALTLAGVPLGVRRGSRNQALLAHETERMLAMRQQSYTWETIGQEFGIEKSAAQKRVARYLERACQ